ncbi:MAG: hypothetical protein PF450_03690 [Bacteroidales bacterium]|jgi:polyhydroxyalkanoate synthesis regulator phasin|nr:hypothetical protein [Bacteroidales bacterium]
MPKAPRIHKKLSDKHVVWFGESNQWVGFEVPAYKVYKWHESGKSKKKIAKKIASKYGLEEKEAKRFVSEIITELERIKVKDLYRPLEDIGNKVNYDISGKNQNASQKISHVYLINS